MKQGNAQWTNDEGGAEGPATTVTFDQRGDKTLLVLHDLYPSKEALDEQFKQLDAILADGDIQ